MAPREREFEGVNLTNITNGSQSNRGTLGHHDPYLGGWRRIGGFTEDFRLHQNEMYLRVIPLLAQSDKGDTR